MKKIGKIQIKLLVMFTILIAILSITSVIYAQDINENIIDIVKNMPKYYVFDMEKFNSQEYSIWDYAPQKIEEYIKQIINDDSIDIKVSNVEGGGNFSFMEFSADIDIFKDGTLCDTVHFGWEDDTQITMFALITVPSTIEKTEEAYIKYANDIIENMYNWTLPYKIEKNDQLKDKDIVLLDTEKFGTIKYKGEDIEANLYSFISQDDLAIPEPLMIMQEVVPEIDIKIIDTIKNIPKYYVFDMEIFNGQEYDIGEYATLRLEEYIKQIINDDSIDIKISDLEGGGNFTFMEYSADINIFKNGILCDTVHFGWEDGTQITMFALITVPSTIEKTEEAYIKYANDIIENMYNWTLPYKIEKNDQLKDKDIVLLDTEKFGTIKYKGEDIEANLYSFISQDELAIPEPLMMMQDDFIITYEVLSGANQKYTINESDTATFIINADYSLFENGGKVYVDDKLVGSNNYTSKSGSTVITFTKNYMSSLNEGEHILKVVFNNGGTSTTKFTIAKDNLPITTEDSSIQTTEKEEEKQSENPKTGDNGIAVWIFLMFASMLGIAGTIKFQRKANKSKK